MYYVKIQGDFAIEKSQRWVSLWEQELLTLPEHLGSSSAFSGDRVAQSLVFCVVFCRSLFVLFSFYHCIFPSIYGLINPLVSSFW